MSALSTEQVNVFRFYMFVFFSVVTQFAHVTCHDAGSDVTKKHTVQQRRIGMNSENTDQTQEITVLRQQLLHICFTGKYGGFEKVERQTERQSIGKEI